MMRRRIAAFRKWLRGVFGLNAHMPARNFLWRAFLIAVPLTAFVLAALAGNTVWAVVTSVAVSLSTANGLWPLRPAWEALDWADEMGAVLFLVVALIAPAILLVCSPFVLIWTLVRAYKRLMQPSAKALN